MAAGIAVAERHRTASRLAIAAAGPLGLRSRDRSAGARFRLATKRQPIVVVAVPEVAKTRAEVMGHGRLG
jgi:hypothetical protein